MKLETYKQKIDEYFDSIQSEEFIENFDKNDFNDIDSNQLVIEILQEVYNSELFKGTTLDKKIEIALTNLNNNF